MTILLELNKPVLAKTPKGELLIKSIGVRHFEGGEPPTILLAYGVKPNNQRCYTFGLSPIEANRLIEEGNGVEA